MASGLQRLICRAQNPAGINDYSLKANHPFGALSLRPSFKMLSHFIEPKDSNQVSPNG